MFSRFSISTTVFDMAPHPQRGSRESMVLSAEQSESFANLTLQGHNPCPLRTQQRYFLIAVVSTVTTDTVLHQGEAFYQKPSRSPKSACELLVAYLLVKHFRQPTKAAIIIIYTALLPFLSVFMPNCGSYRQKQIHQLDFLFYSSSKPDT